MRAAVGVQKVAEHESVVRFGDESVGHYLRRLGPSNEVFELIRIPHCHRCTSPVELSEITLPSLSSLKPAHDFTKRDMYEFL